MTMPVSTCSQVLSFVHAESVNSMQFQKARIFDKLLFKVERLALNRPKI